MKENIIKFIKINYAYFLLGIIVIWGFILRIYGLSSQSYWIDEGYSINAVQAIFKHGYPILDSGMVYTSHIFNTYILFLSSLVFGQNEFGYRITSVLFGTASIVVIFALAKKIFNSEKIALASSFIVGFSTLFIAWSRQARGYSQTQFFYLLTVYFYYQIWNKFSFKKLIILLLLSFATYFSNQLTIVLIPFLLLGLAIKHKNSLIEYIKSHKKISAIITLLFVILFLIATKKYLGEFWIQITSNYSNYSLHFLRYLIDNYILFLIFTVIALYCIFKNKKTRSTGWYFLFIFLLPLIATINLVNVTHYRYIFYLMPMFFLLSAFLFEIIGNLFKNKSIRWIIIIILVLINLPLLSFGFKKTYYLEKITPMPDFKSAYQKIKSEMQPQDIIISPYTPLDKIYLGKSNYWLIFSFTERAENSKKLFNTQRDNYNGVLAIHNADELQDITDKNHGFIIADSMFVNHSTKELSDKIISSYKIFFRSGESEENRLWVFKF